jgi:NAD+ synthase
LSDFNPKLETERIVRWLKEQAAAAGVEGAVFGLSGGIDSAVVAALCRKAFGVDLLGVIMPCHSEPTDVEHAMLVAQAFDMPARLIKLDGVYDSLLTLLDPDAAAQGKRDLATSNLKPRLRMISLYYQANRLNYFVVGTGNKSELTVGYFTKHGDGGVDILPIAHLVKEQVRALAEHLGVPREVIDKPPSAGLWGGQTDEAEMGITYEQLDRYILTGDARNEVKERIEAMKSASEHKRRMPPSLESLR